MTARLSTAWEISLKKAENVRGKTPKKLEKCTSKFVQHFNCHKCRRRYAV